MQVPDKVPKKKAKKKGTIADSLAVLRSSPKTMNLALLVMSYGVSHRLFEFAWKGQLRALYPSAQAYQVHRASHCVVCYLWMSCCPATFPRPHCSQIEAAPQCPACRACWQMSPLPLVG
jgi:ATP/ADP translocase